MDRESKFKALKQIESLNRNPPKPTEGHYAQAREMAKKEKARQQSAEESADKYIANEVKEMAKDVAEHFHTRCTIRQKFSGYGKGKVSKLKCHFCGEHCSDEWTNAKNGKWYGKEHVQFARLTRADQKRERVCLLQRKT